MGRTISRDRDSRSSAWLGRAMPWRTGASDARKYARATIDVCVPKRSGVATRECEVVEVVGVQKSRSEVPVQRRHVRASLMSHSRNKRLAVCVSPCLPSRSRLLCCCCTTRTPLFPHRVLDRQPLAIIVLSQLRNRWCLQRAFSAACADSPAASFNYCMRSRKPVKQRQVGRRQVLSWLGCARVFVKDQRRGIYKMFVSRGCKSTAST
jgi:hypothetical protein